MIRYIDATAWSQLALRAHRKDAHFDHDYRPITGAPIKTAGAALLALAALALPTTGSAQSFYVATNGNDNNPGTQAAPFVSFWQAQRAMRSSSVKTVTFRGGTYSLARTNITFTAADTGQTWIPYNNETVIIDGGGSGYIYMSGANYLKIEGLWFRSLGPGVNTNGGSGMIVGGTGHAIRWNTFLNCNQDCISGSTVYSLIDSNTFNGQSPGNPPGQQYTGAYAAIQLYSSPQSNKISHNLFKNLQGGGIYLAGGSARPMVNNLIDRNIMINVNSNVIDMGAIYVIDTPHTGVGNLVTNNVIQGYGGSTYQSNITKAIYLDNHTSNVLVRGNIIRGSGTFALQIYGGDHNSFTNNIFDFSTAINNWEGTQFLYQDSLAGSVYGMQANLFGNNIIYFSAGPMPRWLWWRSLPANAAYPYVANNLYYAASGGAATTDQDTNPAIANPQFANAAAGNYCMPSSSPVFNLINWTALPTDQGPVASPFVGQTPPLTWTCPAQ